MTTVLLIVIYIAFIGLGIPDSLFGTAWPAIYREFRLPISFASLVTMTISCGTIVSSMVSGRVIGRFGTNRVTAFSTGMTALALLGFSFSQNLWTMCLLAVPLGLGAGAVDTALNNYVALHYSAQHMSFLHCFYGIGVSLSPYLLSLLMNNSQGWRSGYQAAFGIQMGIALITFLSLPLWAKAHGRKDAAKNQGTTPLTFREISRIPGVRLMWCLFLTSCAVECTCGGYCSTFLVECRGMTPEQAAKMVMYYYIGMALGRFLSGLAAKKLHSWRIIGLSQTLLGAALLLLLIPLPSYGAALGLFLTGLSVGPLFPNFNYLTPRNFGDEASQSVMGTQMAASYVGIMLAPATCGILGQVFHMDIFPFYLAAFYLFMLVATGKARKLLNHA